MSPVEFAALVFAGIEQNKFWLTPNPEFRPLMEDRTRQVLAEENPPVMTDISL